MLGRGAAIAAIVLVGAACVAPVPATPAPPPVPPPPVTVTYDGAGAAAARIGLVGDSVMASIRWNGAYAPLRRWNYTYDAESCRRTATASCAGPDGYAPANAVETMVRLQGRLGTVLVMMTGANDPVHVLDDGIDAVLGEARAQGIARVVWLTVHGADDKNAVLAQRAAASGGYLVIADWAGYSAPHPEWANADGLHLNATGAATLSSFIADHIAAVLAGTL